MQTGIYNVVRNPMYLGTMLSWPGACLVFRSWLVLPVFVYCLAFGVLRGGQEERVLREEFSENGRVLEAFFLCAGVQVHRPPTRPAAFS